MLFGIIVFGVFAGQISSNVNVLSAEASISDVTTIGGFTVRAMEKPVLTFELTPCDLSFRVRDLKCSTTQLEQNDSFDLLSLQIGVLQSTDFVELDQIYQFTASYCPDLKSCFDKLDKKTVKLCVRRKDGADVVAGLCSSAPSGRCPDGELFCPPASPADFKLVI